MMKGQFSGILTNIISPYDCAFPQLETATHMK